MNTSLETLDPAAAPVPSEQQELAAFTLDPLNHAALSLDLSPAERMAHLDKAICPYTQPRRQNCAMTCLRHMRTIRIWITVLYAFSMVLVGFALIGKIPLPVGVVGHEGSTVIVVMNSLRLLFGGKTKSKSA